jgi:trypsin
MESTKPSEKNMEVIQGGSGWNAQTTETKTSFDDGWVESTKPPQNTVEEIINDGSDDVAPYIAVAAANNGVKCGMKNRFIALGGVLLVATISTVAIMLSKKDVPDGKDFQVGQQKKPLSAPYLPLSKIYGGSPATRDSWPYMATLQGDNGHFCGGTLIARDVILTAAHCGGIFSTYSAGLGGKDFNNDHDFEVLAVTMELPHPNYNGENAIPDNDFMLLFLEGPSTAENVMTVKLNSYASVPTVGQDVWATGWGDTDQDLMQIEVQVVSNEACEASGAYIGESYLAFYDLITDNMLCAKDDGQDVCLGDDGGPLVINGYDGDIQVGVISASLCATDPFPGVYARVSEAYEWIQDEVCARSNYASEAGFDCSGNPGNDDDWEECTGSTANWVDSWGDGCDWYESNDIPGCPNYGHHGAVANCCYCFDSTIVDPCNICPNGLTADDCFVPYPESGNEYTCQQLIYFAASYESDSETCRIFEVTEQSCCP